MDEQYIVSTFLFSRHCMYGKIQVVSSLVSQCT